jgi:hypothetical protein
LFVGRENRSPIEVRNLLFQVAMSVFEVSELSVRVEALLCHLIPPLRVEAQRCAPLQTGLVVLTPIVPARFPPFHDWAILGELSPADQDIEKCSALSVHCAAHTHETSCFMVILPLNSGADCVVEC